MTLIKRKSAAQRQYRTKSLSRGLITLTECSTDWMSEIHCILNRLEWTLFHTFGCQHPILSDFFPCVFFPPVALRSWQAGCQMSDRCPSVVQCVSFPLTLLGVTRHVSSAHFNNMFAASLFLGGGAPKGHNRCICQEPCQRLYLCQHFFSVSASQTESSTKRSWSRSRGTAAAVVDVCLTA